jgi:hypothetical protein
MSGAPAQAAWVAFLDAQRACAERLQAAAPDEETSTESVGYLARLSASVLSQMLDPGVRMIDDIYYAAARIGGQNPDYRMGSSPIDPNGRYRVSGRLNDAARVAIGLYTPQPQAGLDMDDYRGVWPHEGDSFAVEINGGAGSLTTKPSTTLLMIRELQLRPGGRRAEIKLERLDAPGGRPPLAVDRALGFATGTLNALVDQFIRWSNVISRTPNDLIQMPPELDDVVRGDADTQYCTGHFDLGPDEALEIEMPETDAGYWMIQATNHWLEPIPGASRNNATIDPTTRTVFVGARDPGRPNWLDTQGRRHGQMLARHVGASERRIPKVRKVTIPG